MRAVQGCNVASGQQGSGLTLGAEPHEILLAGQAATESSGLQDVAKLVSMHAIHQRHRSVWDSKFAAQQPGTFFVSLTLPDIHNCAKPTAIS